MPQEDNPAASGAISAPDLSSSLKNRRRAISGPKQAYSIISTLQEASRERNVKNSRIMAKYNSEKPYSASELKAEGLGWKNNFSTKPLPMLIDKVAPRFVKAIDGVKYLTNSSLPDGQPGACSKTEAFRREITSTVRSRAGWNEFVSEVAQENALFGFTAAVWLDEFHWFPKHFRQDEFFVSSGTKQLPNLTQVLAVKESLLVHELFARIEDKEAAATAGWKVAAVVKCLNAAMPEDRRSSWSSWERAYEDLAREANVGLSHEAGAVTVTVWHIFAQEVTGKISHYIYPENTRNIPGEFAEELFEREDQFDEMSQALALFAYQQGNGKLHGSKGIGREVYSMAAMLDKTRNEVVDRLNLSGKIIVQGDEKALRRFKMSVVGNALLIGQDFQVSERKVESAVEPFLALDTFLTGLLDQMVGATSPKAFAGDRTTKAEVDIVSSREEESRDNILSRWLNQFARFMTTLQRRLCDADTADEDAKEMQKRLLAVMTREELDQLVKTPVAETVEDYTELQRQQVAMVAAQARGNPLYNQKEVERRKLIAQVDEEFANAVLLPDEDPTALAEQTRLQQLELLILAGQGSSVPVSPRDNHIVHLQVLMPAMESAGVSAVESADGVTILQALLEHAQQHFDNAKAQGTSPEALAPFEEVLNKVSGAMVELQQLSQQAAELDAAPTAEAALQQPPAPVQ